MTDSLAIQTRALTKHYGRTGEIKALTAIDLEIKRGELFGFLGPNGAGKSTLFRALSGGVEGPHAGKTIIRTWTFGAKALPYTKRDLSPFGLTTAAKLLSTFPEPGREYFVRLVVALQRGDDAVERNDVKKIDLVRVDESPAAGFMLPGQAEGGPK